ncbi:hypothetical protein TrRE_jg10023 [Triparma retinervis]|uniref:Uncharacterized protein n=1 Tax=Triparma retinervis TaxID=2557542 RepID=A0A9W7A994_9STRA|nr:hypothetical protein TrRE_jg10023 [Triparma retinervis]
MAKPLSPDDSSHLTTLGIHDADTRNIEALEAALNDSSRDFTAIPIPDGIDLFHLEEEVEATEMSALEAVMSVDEERARLEKDAEELNDLVGAIPEDEPEADLKQEKIMDLLNMVYERLDEMDAETAEVRALNW